MSTTRKALFRPRAMHWRRKENVNDAKGAHPSSSSALEERGKCQRRKRRSSVLVWSIEGERRMTTTPTALIRLRVMHWRRDENVDDAKGAHPFSCDPLEER